jgi:hypothetical protein
VGSSGVSTGSLAISDGSTEGGYLALNTLSGNVPFTVEADFSVTTGGNKTFSLVGKSNAGSYIMQNQVSGANSYFSIYRYPSSSQQAFNFDSVNWKVDVNIGGADIDLGSTDQSSYASMANSGLDLVINTDKGSTSDVAIGCSDGSIGTTTCSTGNEQNAIVFSPPRAGVYEACAQFAHNIVSGAGVSITGGAFQIQETNTGGDTIAQSGGGAVFYKSGASNQVGDGFNLCGTFKFDSTSQRKLQVMYEQDVTGSLSSNIIKADRDASFGSIDINWTVRPLDIQYPAPVINNSVTGYEASPSRIVWTYYYSTSFGLSCSTAACSTLYSSSDWFSSFDRDGAGDYSVNIRAGVFSGEPVCFVNGGFKLAANFDLLSATQVDFRTRDSAGDQSDSQGMLMCVGPR